MTTIVVAASYCALRSMHVSTAILIETLKKNFKGTIGIAFYGH